jgi:hypothetical protein
MTVWQVNRGDDPKNEVFVKKFLEKFSPILGNGFINIFINKINIMKKIIRLTESDLARIVKRVIKEEEQIKKTITCNLSTDGIKNVTPEMISADPREFFGQYNKYKLEGEFKKKRYVWDGTGVPGFGDGGEGYARGYILTGNNSSLTEDGITDAEPNGVWIGFNGSGLKFFCYKSTEGSLKCSNF